MDEVNVTIIGAGVVGLAIAAELSDKVHDIVVLEQHSSFGQETSSRNSEVIHSGIYYPNGSLKTELCLKGAGLLYQLCERYSIPCKRLGKLIVAKNAAEIKNLKNLYNNGIRNRVSAITMIDKKEVSKISLKVTAEAAIYLRNTGIIDSHSLMRHYVRYSEERGATMVFNSKVASIERMGNRYKLSLIQDNYKFRSQVVINCAGLSSDRVAALAGIDVVKNAYNLHYCKGSYFSYLKPYPMPMLIYPVPHEELTGLGVHATIDLGGRLRFGPDTEYVDHPDYSVNENKRDAFYESASHIFKDLDKEAFVPDMAGIRPKLSGPGQKVRDFVIVDEAEKGLPGFINLIGIESPGLTSAPAIAQMVYRMVIERLK